MMINKIGLLVITSQLGNEGYITELLEVRALLSANKEAEVC